LLFYIKKILKDYENLGKQGTPGSKTMFEVDKSAEELGELEKKEVSYNCGEVTIFMQESEA
jgi:hypothetical protein